MFTITGKGVIIAPPHPGSRGHAPTMTSRSPTQRVAFRAMVLHSLSWRRVFPPGVPGASNSLPPWMRPGLSHVSVARGPDDSNSGQRRGHGQELTGENRHPRGVVPQTCRQARAVDPTSSNGAQVSRAADNGPRPSQSRKRPSQEQPHNEPPPLRASGPSGVQSAAPLCPARARGGDGPTHQGH
jgi:hypothetical protein